MNEWPLQDARNKFGAVVDAAVAGEPQRVTRRGKPAVVVLSVEEYERLCRLEKAKAPTFTDLLLAIPQDDEEFEPPYPANLTQPETPLRPHQPVAESPLRFLRVNPQDDWE